MSNKLVEVFDLGTQSIKGMIINEKGEILFSEKIKYNEPYYSKAVGYAEQSFDEYYRCFKKVAFSLKEQSEYVAKDILAVSITTFRDTFTVTDEFGNPKRDFILWLDSRRAEAKKKLPILQRLLFKLVKMEYCIKSQQGLCRQIWIKENEKELWDSSAKFASIQAILNKRLTGEFKEVEASCIGHVPHDYKKGGWLKESELTYPIYDLSKDKLVEMVPTLSTIGYISKECAEETGLIEGLPLIASAADKACELAGSGIRNDDAFELAFGTSVSIEYLTDKYIAPDPFMPAYPSLNPKKYISEVQIYRGCWMITDFIEHYCYEEREEASKLNIPVEVIMDSHLKEIPLGCKGLMLMPHWNPPLTNPEARGTMIGFLPDHNKYYIYRAIIEGIGYTLYENYLKLEKRCKRNSKYAVMSGGGSKSDDVCQIISDILGVEIRKPAEFEATAMGVAIGSFVSLGVYEDFDKATKNMVAYNKIFTPNKENHNKYMEIYNNIYKKVNEKMNPLYKGYYKVEL
ncbi:MAG: FGGY-family carbohydrate kinase [Gammaproteobacteria bacterium]|nr:FGGY-family carbohydrate kinase [Gammaproteobacteria bacterium]